ncbi:MAG TPA: hypothetical protein DCY93_03080 [Firmicutes bacterium]|nr:hypothetical protein [Bacillota bacterium]
MKFYYSLFKKQIPLLLVDIFCLMVDVALEMAQPFLMAIILDEGIKKQDFNIIWIVSAIMLAMAIVAILFSVLAMNCSVKIANRFCYDIRKQIFHKIQTFSFKNIDEFEVPSLITRITSDVNIIRQMMTMVTRAGLKVPLMMIVGSVFMFIYNLKLAAIVLAVCVVLCFSIIFIIYRSSPKFQKMQVALDDINQVIEEDIDGIRVVKSFVREDHEINKFQTKNDRLMNLGIRAFQVSSINIPLILFGANICNALILGLGGIDVAKGTSFTTGRLSSFVNFSTIVLMAFNMVSGIAINISRSSACFKRLNQIINVKIDIPYEKKEKTDDFDPSVINDGSVEFIDATFSYSNDKEKLAVGPVNMKVNAGEIIGIVGGTGSGKSSLVSLIPRLYDTLSGQVKVSRRDVKDYDLISLRENIGVVTQKNVLFTGTIRDNIKWGKEDATDEEINAVLKKAQAYDFVHSFNDGLDTLVSQGGTSVSGGQKQRLSIARALIKEPKILILDDSTSALDVETEAKLKKNIYNNEKKMTIFIIAQRISSVMDADKILVLDNGKVDNIGTHEELLKNSSIYRDMYVTQQKGVD